MCKTRFVQYSDDNQLAFAEQPDCGFYFIWCRVIHWCYYTVDSKAYSPNELADQQLLLQKPKPLKHSEKDPFEEPVKAKQPRKYTRNLKSGGEYWAVLLVVLFPVWGIFACLYEAGRKVLAEMGQEDGLLEDLKVVRGVRKAVAGIGVAVIFLCATCVLFFPAYFLSYYIPSLLWIAYTVPCRYKPEA